MRTKFELVVACQKYGDWKQANDPQANDVELKSTMARLEAQDNYLATTAKSLADDHAFVKNVIEQVTLAVAGHSDGCADFELERRELELFQEFVVFLAHKIRLARGLVTRFHNVS